MIDSKHSDLESHILDLLPWYVNGSLSVYEHTRVDNYLARHPEAIHTLTFLRKIQTTTTKKIDIPKPDLHKVMQKLDKTIQVDNESVIDKLHQLFSSVFYPAAAWSALSIVFALTVMLLSTPNFTNRNPEFQTLSSGQDTSALTIKVTLSVNDSTASLVEQIYQLIPNAHIRIDADHQLVITAPDTIESEAALKLLGNIQSLPVVNSAEMTSTSGLNH